MGDRVPREALPRTRVKLPLALDWNFSVIVEILRELHLFMAYELRATIENIPDKLVLDC